LTSATIGSIASGSRWRGALIALMRSRTRCIARRLGQHWK
jgi:hypothetical protein